MSANVMGEQALALDDTDVLVWYQMGKTALETGQCVLWQFHDTRESRPFNINCLRVLHGVGCGWRGRRLNPDSSWTPRSGRSPTHFVMCFTLSTMALRTSASHNIYWRKIRVLGASEGLCKRWTAPSIQSFARAHYSRSKRTRL
jgi:hypothetical protein